MRLESLFAASAMELDFFAMIMEHVTIPESLTLDPLLCQVSRANLKERLFSGSKSRRLLPAEKYVTNFTDFSSAIVSDSLDCLLSDLFCQPGFHAAIHSNINSMGIAIRETLIGETSYVVSLGLVSESRFSDFLFQMNFERQCRISDPLVINAELQCFVDGLSDILQSQDKLSVVKRNISTSISSRWPDATRFVLLSLIDVLPNHIATHCLRVEEFRALLFQDCATHIGISICKTEAGETRVLLAVKEPEEKKIPLDEYMGRNGKVCRP
jgi:hypothetical protein